MAYGLETYDASGNIEFHKSSDSTGTYVTQGAQVVAAGGNTGQVNVSPWDQTTMDVFAFPSNIEHRGYISVAKNANGFVITNEDSIASTIRWVVVENYVASPAASGYGLQITNSSSQVIFDSARELAMLHGSDTAPTSYSQGRVYNPAAGEIMVARPAIGSSGTRIVRVVNDSIYSGGKRVECWTGTGLGSRTLTPLETHDLVELSATPAASGYGLEIYDSGGSTIFSTAQGCTACDVKLAYVSGYATQPFNYSYLTTQEFEQYVYCFVAGSSWSDHYPADISDEPTGGEPSLLFRSSYNFDSTTRIVTFTHATWEWNGIEWGLTEVPDGPTVAGCFFVGGPTA